MTDNGTNVVKAVKDGLGDVDLEVIEADPILATAKTLNFGEGKVNENRENKK